MYIVPKPHRTIQKKVQVTFLSKIAFNYLIFTLNTTYFTIKNNC